MKSIALCLLFSMVCKAGAEVSPASIDLLGLDKAPALVSEGSHGGLKYKLVTANHGSHVTKLSEGDNVVWEGSLYSEECDSVVVNYGKDDKVLLVNVTVRSPKDVSHVYFENKDGSYRKVNGLAYTYGVENSVLEKLNEVSLDLSAVGESTDAFHVGELTENGLESKVFAPNWSHFCNEVKDGEKTLWKAEEEERVSFVLLHGCSSCGHLHVTVVHPVNDAKELFFKKSSSGEWELSEGASYGCNTESLCSECKASTIPGHLRGDNVYLELPCS